MRIGIDVGGTNTDAVLLEGERILAAVKRPTTPDTAAGVADVLTDVLRAAGREPAQVQAVMVGTTQFTNAFIEARGLAATGVIRLGRPATTSIPPLTGWPARLRTAIGGPVFLCRGGSEYDGGPIAPLDEAEIVRAARTFAAQGVRSVAISSVFAPVNADCEERAAGVVQALLPDAFVSLSHELGRLGLLERENATTINAALRGLAADFIDALQAAVRGCGVIAPVLVSQNDGTLMNLPTARRRPVSTFASGPTNSIRGAAWLSGLTDCVVVDVGGTTTDIGVLVRGFPRERTGVGYLAGVRTNVRMPDIRSLGVGGGSRVRGIPWTGRAPGTDLSVSRLPVIRIDRRPGPHNGARARTVRVGAVASACPVITGVMAPAMAIEPPARVVQVTAAAAAGQAGAAVVSAGVEVGPDSVAGELTSAAVVFGGRTVTATDLAVAVGRANLGDRRRVQGLDRRAVRHTLARIARRIARVADDMRTSPEPLPLVVVGGAGFLVPAAISGFAKVHRPAYHGVANAVGAAIALIGAEVDRVFQIDPDSRERVLADAKAEAVSRAVEAGAREEAVEVVEVEEIPLAYVTGGAARIRIKAVGELDLVRLGDDAGGAEARRDVAHGQAVAVDARGRGAGGVRGGARQTP